LWEHLHVKNIIHDEKSTMLKNQRVQKTFAM